MDTPTTTKAPEIKGYCGHCGGAIKDAGWQSALISGAPQKFHITCLRRITRPQYWPVSVHNRRIFLVK